MGLGRVSATLPQSGRSERGELQDLRSEVRAVFRPVDQLALQWMYLQSDSQLRRPGVRRSWWRSANPSWMGRSSAHDKGADHALLRVTWDGAVVGVGARRAGREGDGPFVHTRRGRVTEEPQG